MSQKHSSYKFQFIAAFMILAFVLGGCAAPTSAPADAELLETAVVPVTGDQPTAVVSSPSPLPNTPPPPTPTEKAATTNFEVLLADGSKLIIPSDTQYEVISIPEKGAKTGDVRIKLLQGLILAIPNPENGFTLSVEDSSGYYSRVDGCSMMVSSDPATKDFGMNCLAGDCEIGKLEGRNISVKSNEEWTYKAGMLQGPAKINLVSLQQAFGKFLPACAMIIPVTGQDTAETIQPIATLNAQATNSCNAFRAQFPGTPCP